MGAQIQFGIYSNCFLTLFSVLMRLLVSISSELIFEAFKKVLCNAMTWSQT